MAKSDATAASQAHPPAKKHMEDQKHAHHYPGKSVPKADKVVDASHDAAALKSGRLNSMGVSANGSHKGLPSSMEQIGQ